MVFVGLDQTSEAENFDRNNLTLPGVQKELVQSVLAAQPNTVVVLVNGGPVSSEWIASNVPAVVEAFYPGELGGDAIVDVLVGDYNPGGKMLYTVYPENFTDSRDIRDMDPRATMVSRWAGTPATLFTLLGGASVTPRLRMSGPTEVTMRTG